MEQRSGEFENDSAHASLEEAIAEAERSFGAPTHAWSAVLSGQGGSGDPPKMNRIPLEQLEDMFRAMRAQSGMDVDGPLLWGYFFTGSDPDKLEAVAAELQTRGYRLANLYPTDDGETHFLHVERIEPHTPLSLHERNAEFYALADTYGLESYDGMDVGPVEPMQGSLRRPWWKFW